jgi:hypothetical protein
VAWRGTGSSSRICVRADVIPWHSEMGLQGAKWNGLDDTPQRLEDTLRECARVREWRVRGTKCGSARVRSVGGAPTWSCMSDPEGAHTDIAGMIKVIDSATKDTTSGLMVN